MTRRTADTITDDELDALYDQLDAQQRTTRVIAALHRSAEETVTRVIALAERWQHTGDRKGGPLRELRTALGAPPVADGEERQPGGTAVLTVAVTAPTQENAEQWATTLRDLIAAEHGGEMRLHMAISPGDGRGQDTVFPAANRPGSTAEQLPDRILALLAPAEYTSTACETAARLEAVTAEDMREELRGEVAYWVRWLYERCRLNQKFTGELCASPSHRQAEDAAEEGPGRPEEAR